jgi:hypothetical protein
MIEGLVLAIINSIISSPLSSGLLGSIWVNLGTQIIKELPVGPSGGSGLRVVAAVLSIAVAVTKIALQGHTDGIDAAEVGQALLDIVVTFIAATGLFQLGKKA